ncbi:MAG: glycoside hydrolase family 3 C-terminal domain-containing protein, partial [Agathobacter sp.]|nr:glycoside hydrolase family 3 C-terminal domain-containing protein [Agathobacter sp.]
MDKKEIKARKKAYKKARSKATRPWKWLTWISAPLAIILTAATVVVGMFDNTFALFLGGTFWEVVNEDPNAIYYKGEFETEEERNKAGAELVKQVEAEGAALLTNNENGLPLAKGAKVSLFSTSSVNIVYGGTGSGNVDASKSLNLKQALEQVGKFEVNPTLWDFYSEGGAAAEYTRGNAGAVVQDSATASGYGSAEIVEAPWKLYEETEGVLDSIEQYGDAAIVVLSRIGGEGADSYFDHELKDGKNYLALNDIEREMMSNVKKLKDEGKIGKIIVLINTSNALQVDFLKNNEYGVDATLWIGGVGQTGLEAVAEILNGTVNPSGSLADTYCYDNYSSPVMQNFTPIQYTGDLTAIPEHADTYMIYQEGIYVGYKYYETRYEDTVMGKGNTAGYVYSDDVAFPFGYGLSYTTFEYSDMTMEYNKDAQTYTITV